MADETDFLELYGMLRLRPDCSLDEFRLAYRRYVAHWHPDRRRGERAQVLAAERLQRLTAQYDAAMAFHRRHGRLPGGVAEWRATPRRVATQEDAAFLPDKRPVRKASSKLLVVSILLGIVVLGAALFPSTTPEVATPDDVVTVARANTPVATDELHAGMSMDEVRHVEGEPTRRGELRWEYGASWIAFDRGSVSDWYSSPWNPLHAPTTRMPR
ncbi:MAG: hypothetical protein GAK28_00817 [Luteibacter sp.]|uniref:J domain-containing protein n=1 Tax=Luteibacter sp. TaxID=1886636 RepID=UPI0013863268|nr:J domain-containing protein [Luteibacter sp.]KAF1009184.1 MAG: hypothetical protein GAK28_00817 [Luteibacter sp.]